LRRNGELYAGPVVGHDHVDVVGVALNLGHILEATVAALRHKKPCFGSYLRKLPEQATDNPHL